ncbi:hypothetical protein KP79_PYT12705 [Mizuhopecten yessoensis]|uniref:Uncharacterized protein n=1 Tax=Mizuhopecten yessoensis TaxID=6573 RepID=A0A210PL95_MIZYE|nr:hypothetical protein KP79_PYT12705 [Mizuhopecten yessoensis]
MDVQGPVLRLGDGHSASRPGHSVSHSLLSYGRSYESTDRTAEYLRQAAAADLTEADLLHAPCSSNSTSEATACNMSGATACEIVPRPGGPTCPGCCVVLPGTASPAVVWYYQVGPSPCAPDYVPNKEEKVALLKAGLVEKKIIFRKNFSPEFLKTSLLEAYPLIKEKLPDHDIN